MAEESGLRIEVEPGEVGLDPERLARIDRLFDGYVEDGRLAGWIALVSRFGRVAHLSRSGMRDIDAKLPVELDTRWRIFSMTKPITSVAALMLYEEGRLALTDPVARYIPAFDNVRVYSKGSSLKPLTVPAQEPVRIWHLLTHTSGLTYGFHHAHPVDAMYRAAGFEWGSPKDMDLAACCDAWAALPLVFQPGTEWNYSVSTDVLGRVVEVVSGQPLDRFLEERILAPLGMTGTAFWTDDDRLATLYAPDPRTGRAVRNAAFDVVGRRPPAFLSGGGGLVSTAADYHRFTRMLLGGGSLDGVRLLGSRTVDYMSRNHLPGGADLEEVGRPLFAEMPFSGVGFGLGVSVVVDPTKGRSLCSAGEIAWGGAASTAFWIDPTEELTAIFLTQLMPSSTHPIRSQFRTLVYQALVDRPPQLLRR
ncbi:MAG TPA: serine hydrolase domain-containing protein [Candidatus Dormibacteraeota bacterium]|jgi:CubicO group peptidase (beta-lactamase class C family)|nr:serine hydrolase domain-containing protein [Candidatus Dormibacteraeota bacterium]